MILFRSLLLHGFDEKHRWRSRVRLDARDVRLLGLLSCAAIVLSFGIAPVNAGTIAPAIGSSVVTLSNGNSETTLNPNSSSGVTSWTVDGVNQLYQQWFWYRLGSSGLQSSIDTLDSAPLISQASPSQASVTYSGSNLAITVSYLLTGGDPLSGSASLGESIRVTNTSSSPQDVHFFQYSNFTLDNVVGNDTVQFQNSNAVSQWNGSGNETLGETVITPRANYREAGEILPPSDPQYTTLDTLYKLNNIPGYQLAFQNTNTTSAMLGPADVTWAYEWDRTLLPGGSMLISKSKSISGVLLKIPEPSSAVLTLAGLLALAATCWRKSRAR